MCHHTKNVSYEECVQTRNAVLNCASAASIQFMDIAYNPCKQTDYNVTKRMPPILWESTVVPLLWDHTFCPKEAVT